MQSCCTPLQSNGITPYRSGLRAIQNPSKEKHGACVSLSISQLNIHQPRDERGFIAAGNALSSCPNPMPLETQMTLALLQQLLMALRANDADG
jgi:hypothetical protein